VVVTTNSASMMNKAVKLVAPTPPTSSSPERVSGKHRFDNSEAEADVRMRVLPHNLISFFTYVTVSGMKISNDAVR